MIVIIIFFISVEADNGYQKLTIEESMNTSTTVVEKKEVIKFSNEEHNLLPKTKSVFDRLVKAVGNISVVPKKWNKKKVKCTSLWLIFVVCIQIISVSFNVKDVVFI